MWQRSELEWYQALGANLGQILYMSARDNIVSASLALHSVTYSSVLHEPNGRAKQGHDQNKQRDRGSETIYPLL